MLTPAVAHADSISFLRGGNIWVAATDGTQQTQVTTGGGYAYQSRADDGSFIALAGRQLHRLSPTGQLLAQFNTPVSFESPAGTPYFLGPYKPEISPDGSKVAYEYWHQDYGLPGCTPTWQCNRISVGIGYSYPDRNTSWDEPGLGRQSGWTDPSWIDNGTLLMSDKSVYPNADAVIDRPGDGNNVLDHWFEDRSDVAWHLRDAEISRRGDAITFVSTKPRTNDDPKIGQEDDTVIVYRMTGPSPAQPTPCFGVRDDDRVMVSPTFAPDGHAIAFTSKRRASTDTVPPRIEIVQVPNLTDECKQPDAGSSDLIIDAENPDWSPAGVPTIRTTDTGTRGGTTPDQGKGGTTDTGKGGTTDTGKGGGNPPGTTVVTKQGVTLTVKPSTVAETLKRGLRPEVAVPGAGKLEVKATYKGKTVATGRATAKAAGTLKPKLTVNAAGKRALKKTKKAAVTLRFTFKPTSGKAVTSTAKFTLSG
jgi:Tol biopolymer transport system component